MIVRGLYGPRRLLIRISEHHLPQKRRAGAPRYPARPAFRETGPPETDGEVLDVIRSGLHSHWLQSENNDDLIKLELAEVRSELTVARSDLTVVRSELTDEDVCAAVVPHPEVPESAPVVP